MAKPKAEEYNLTALISDVFIQGFKAAADDVFKDSQEALDDDQVAEKLAELHEKFANEMIAKVEGSLDVDSEEEGDNEEEADD